MLIVVTFVGLLVHVYSVGYMHEDRDMARYFAGLSLFMFSMLGIVLADNLVMMFIFWELVGVSSYLLIGHWYERPVGGQRGQQGLPGQPHRRFRFHGGHPDALAADWLGGFRHHADHARARSANRRRAWSRITGSVTDRGHAFPVLRSDGQICPGAAARLAAGCHGRPDTRCPR